MNDNKPIRPLSYRYGRRIARQFATETAQKWRVVYNSHPDVDELDAQDFKEAVQNLTTMYLETMVNKGLVAASA